MKLSFIKEQEEMLYLLQLEGLRRKIELQEAQDKYEKAVEIEKEVENYVIQNNVYYSDCPDMPELNGKRILDEFNVCLINDSILESDYLPKMKEAFRSLYNIDNPLNFVYSYPMRERLIKAERSYQMIAVEFLRIIGSDKEAEQIEQALKTYLKPELKEKLVKLNDAFILGKGSCI